MKLFIYALIWILSLSTTLAQNTGLLFTDPQTYDKIGVAALPLGAGEIPTSIDLSQSMPPVGDQNPQNSCVAWAVAYACRTYYEKDKKQYSYITSGNQINYDGIFSPSFIYNQINNGQNKGTYFEDAFNVLINDGVCTYRSMPYSPNDFISQPTQVQKNEAKNFKIDTYRRVELQAGGVSIKAELVNKNPVIAASIFDQTYYNSGFSSSGSDHIWRQIGAVNNAMGHAILIVGYDDSKQAFKFMNSWGTKWGKEGYGWIGYQIIDQVIRQAYILKPKFNDNIHTNSNPTPSYITNTNNDLNNNDINIAGLNFALINVTHENSFTHPGVPFNMRKMNFSGFFNIPRNTGRTAQIAINFYVNNNGVKGAPVGTLDSRFGLANGQAATGTPLVNLPPNQDFTTNWFANIPYVVLNIPKGMMIQTPFGPKYQPATSFLIAEPVLFIDNFPLRVGQQIPFSVSQ